MRIELEHTLEDWYAFRRVLQDRIQSFRLRVVFGVVIGALVIALLLIPRRFGILHLDGVSMLVGVVLVFLYGATLMRLNKSTIPQSWLGPHVFELDIAGIHVTAPRGTSSFPWRTIQEVDEAPN